MMQVRPSDYITCTSWVSNITFESLHQNFSTSISEKDVLSLLETCKATITILLRWKAD